MIQIEADEPVTVIQRGTGNILKGRAAPHRKLLVKWLMDHPSYEVFILAGDTEKGK